MLFHSIHGDNIVLEEGATRATRFDSFCHGITFSAMPLEINVHVTVIATQVSDWSGALRLGVTSCNPDTLDSLPRYACPDLITRQGFWADAIPEKLIANGNRITFHLTDDGSLILFINNEQKGTHLSGLPVHEPLWALLDVYGNTQSIQFTSNDSVPIEIMARGPQAMYTFRLAKKSGTLPVYRTRLVLVGQDGAGKTSLKHLLTGQRYYEQDRLKSDNVVTTGWCEINQQEPGSWLWTEEEDISSSAVDDGGGTLSMSEGYFGALAANIARELLMAQKRGEEDAQEEQVPTTNGTRVRSSSAERGGATLWTQQDDRRHICTARFRHRYGRRARMARNVQEMMTVEQLREDLLHEVPESVVEMVDALLTDAAESTAAKRQLQDSKTDDILGPNILLNVWDLSGKSIYHAIHQVFLSSRAVYLLVFNLCQDLDAPALIPIVTSKGTMVELEESEMTNLDELNFWFNCIYAHTTPTVTLNASETEIADEDLITTPPAIIVVGTHKKNLHPDSEIRDNVIEEKFQMIQDSIRGKAFEQHVIKPFFAVDNTDEEDLEVSRLRECVEEVVSQEPYIGEEIPKGWLKFEASVSRLVEKGVAYSTKQQLQEVALSEGIDADDTFTAMLEFYHDLGLLVHYGSSLDENLAHTVILDPKWLIETLGKVFAIAIESEEKDSAEWAQQWNSVAHLKKDGILEESLLDIVWTDHLDQKTVLIALLEKFDLLCRRVSQLDSPDLILPAIQEETITTYYMPSQVKKNVDADTWIPPVNRSVVFYLDFMDFLPVSLYHRLATRALSWSWSEGRGTTREPKLAPRLVRLYLDQDHDFLLQMAPIKLARIKVIITKIITAENADEIKEEEAEFTPCPNACAKVRHFIEGALADIHVAWAKRLVYRTSVECNCGRECALHHQRSCRNESCLHFLLLDECLANKVVSCDHQRIKTHFIRHHFPAVIRQVRPGPVFPTSALLRTSYNETLILDSGGRVPRWIKSAAKLLNAGSEGNDWTALAAKLGYKTSLVTQFGEDLNPGLALVTDWLLTSGNTQVSVDMLVACLSRIHRDDVIDLIHKSEESDEDNPPVFLSYQWDIQDEVLLLRTRLEQAGFRCWMDVGQMGGGDLLHLKIYEGINHAKVIVACISPKYVVSHSCNQEVILADLLSKPIIPAMIQETPWPPPGGMAMVLGQLIYVDFDGSGGHGGSGKHNDWESRFSELCLRVTRFVDPVPPHTPSEDLIKTPEVISANHRTSRLSLADLVAFPLVSRRESVPIMEEDDSSESSAPSTPRPVIRGRVRRCAICTIL